MKKGQVVSFRGFPGSGVFRNHNAPVRVLEVVNSDTVLVAADGGDDEVEFLCPVSLLVE